MKNRQINNRSAIAAAFLFAAALNACSSAANPSAKENLALPTSPRQVLSFDNDWKFLKSDVPNAPSPGLDDASWRNLNLPHDWSIEGPFDKSNLSGGAGAFLPSGIVWYRKSFTLPPETNAKRISIEFDGVMANSDVYLNGTLLGHRPYGYASFSYDLTPNLKPGQNILAVKCDTAQQPASRWYAGAGIYRHVRLVTTNDVHIAHWGTFITTSVVTPEKAVIHVQNTVRNDSNALKNFMMNVLLFNAAGKVVAKSESNALTVDPGKEITISQDVSLKPELWDLGHPKLYTAICRIVDEKQESLDINQVSFGIRSAEFKPDTGFWLNGKNIKLKGVCLHNDAGGVGTAVPLAAWQHRLAALKELGVNAIRTAHNPPSPEFLDLCDQMGFLVMDENFDCWTVAKNKFDYHLYFKDWFVTDTRDMVLRDRNHPSVILYSAGNEIHDTPKADIAIPILKQLVDTFHQYDPTRPVTQALFRPNTSHDYTNGLADLLDVVGTNYRDAELLRAHADKPSRKIIGTENGISLNAWLAVRDHPEYSGQFLWVGVEYLGEARKWPSIYRENGLLDLTDEPHPVAFQRQSWWSDKPMVYLIRDVGDAPTGNIPGEPQTRPRQFPDWSPTNHDPHTESVFVFSNCDSVELFLNNKSLGSQLKPADDSPRKWKVSFEPGTIHAVAKNNDKEVATNSWTTAGPPAKLVLSADKDHVSNNWEDLTFVKVTVTDKDGNRIPEAVDNITFQLTGPGSLAAVENANPDDPSSFQNTNQRKAYRGTATALVRASATTGQFTITATAPGLEPATFTLKATK